MPKIKFTAATIKALSPDKTKTIEYVDSTRARGTGRLSLRISKTGLKTWSFRYLGDDGDGGRKEKRISLGQYPEVGLADARKKATNTITDTGRGSDPHMEAKRKISAPTVEMLWDVYIKQRDNAVKKKAPKTIYEENRRWNSEIKPRIGFMKVEEVEPVHISDMLDEVAKRAPVSANRLYKLLRIIFKPALAKGWIKVHPLQWIDSPGGQEVSRKRFLSEDEISTVWPHFDELRPNPRDILKMGLYTAQRPGEIYSMKWENVDLDTAIWRQPTNKTNTYHIVPLSSQVVEILRERQGYQAKEVKRRAKRYKIPETPFEYVFQTFHNRTRAENASLHTTSLKEARKKVAKDSGVSGWTSHDLRRTARTLLSAIKVDREVRERIINHAVNGIEGVYDMYDFVDEKRDGLQRLADKIDEIRGVTPGVSTKIIKFRKTA